MHNRSIDCLWKEKKEEKCSRRHACIIYISSQYMTLTCPRKSTKWTSQGFINNIGIYNPSTISSMTNFRDLCDFHSDITTEFSANSIASHSRTSRASSSRTSHASSLKQINLYNRHSNTLSKTTSLSYHDSLLIKECSNTNVSFFISLSIESLLLFMINVLWVDEIADLLKIYLNQCFVDTLTSIALYDACVDFQGNSFDHIWHSNHFSMFAHLEIVMKSIQNELQKRRVK